VRLCPETLVTRNDPDHASAHALNASEPLVREHAAWALARLLD
jgi:hypothetical protein